MSTIATPYDIFRNANIEKGVDIINICRVLKIKEEALFNNNGCLGREFYNSLKLDVFTPSPVLVFDYGISYTVGQFVNFNGEIWEVVTATTGQEAPDNSNSFKIPKKMVSADNEELWQSYLLFIIAIDVEIAGYLDASVSWTASGLVRKKSDNFNPAEQRDIDVKTHNLQNLRTAHIENLKVFLEENASNYPLALTCKNKCNKVDEIFPNKKPRQTHGGFSL